MKPSRNAAAGSARLRSEFVAAVSSGLVLLVLCTGVLLTLRPARAGDPAPAASDTSDESSEVTRLIDQLGDQRFFVRQHAQEELAKRGFAVFDALSEAENHPDIEIAARARYLLRSLEVEWVRDSDPAVIREMLDEYEELDVTHRGLQIDRIARLPREVAVGALVRLARFEHSPVLSKRAALALAVHTHLDESTWDEYAELIDRALGASTRTAATWLRISLEAATSPEAAYPRWVGQIDRETALRQHHPQRTSPEIIVAMRRCEVPLLERLERYDEAQSAMLRMLDVDESPSPALMLDTVSWFAQRGAWAAVDAAEEKFPLRFEREPRLLYIRAQGEVARDRADAAEYLVVAALALHPNAPQQHLSVAQNLRTKGLIDWAVREYRTVIDNTPRHDRDIWMAHLNMADMLHDQSRDLEAVKLLDGFIGSLKVEDFVQKNNNRKDAERIFEAIRRTFIPLKSYYEACHHEARREFDKQRTALEAVTAINPMDVEAIIALYHLADQEPERRKKTLELIRTTAEYFRSQIKSNQQGLDIPKLLNQLAWLVSNTEGNQEEALRSSARSLELNPGSAGYQDTLARCYFAQKEYEQAVHYQTLAVAQEPHSGQMRSQLDLFQRTLAQSRDDEP